MKPEAVIFDRDGTLARVDRRFVTGEEKDWASFDAAMVFDSPVPEIVALTHAIKPGVVVIVTSGRSERLRRQMMDWLHKHNVHYHGLLMRELGDQRRDDVVKREIYKKRIAPYFDVKYVVDDRPEVCDMWRELGLPLLQVSQPESIPPFIHLGSDND